ncbi:MAG TPA: hypothetical protein VK911_14580, partial [Vicinamibacterales bacterium]|nr:hypothetical protein [Vicinamibacterales bacterium]
MLRSRRQAAPRPSRQTTPELQSPLSPAGPVPSIRDLLLHAWAGRLFLAAGALKLVVALLRRLVGAAAPVEFVSTLATIGLVISVGYFVWRLFVLMKRRLLWRVRRKLILSYIFM